MKRIFVGNLSYQASEAQLQGWLNENGISAENVSIVRDRTSGESRGFGFFEVRDELVDRTIETCNGQDFMGRRLVVNEARPRENRAPIGRGGHA